ncbi:MAG: 2TM domain-containing protein [Planctomycetota bacterium]
MAEELEGPVEAAMALGIERRDYEAAARRVRDRLAFYEHCTWFFWLNLLFLAVNALVTPGTWWFVPAALLWGAGLLVHLVAVFLIGDLRGPYHRRSFLKELDRLRRRERR